MFLARTALAAPPQPQARDTILVVLELGGGNDGLNTVVPYADDVYAKQRPTLRLRADEVHKIDSLLGFHPRMPAFMRLYRDGLVSVVQGVGYPNPHQGHFESMRIWQSADPTMYAPQTGTVSFSLRQQTGWLGRAIDQATRGDPALTPGAFVGQIAQPFALNAERSVVPSIRSLEDATLRRLPGDEPAHQRRLVEAATAARGQDDTLLNFIQRTTLAAYRSGDQIEAAAKAATANSADYPAFALAKTLHLVAQLISADVGIRVYYVELAGGEIGGFDTHAGQADNHAALLHQLSEAVTAFMNDLKRDKLVDRVLLLTFSEFGRTVQENGRRGTDHGSAAPMFLVGGRVKGGLIGAHPNLTDLENGGQKHHTDFRRVYAAVLERWLGFDSQAVLGARFEPVDVVR